MSTPEPPDTSGTGLEHDERVQIKQLVRMHVHDLRNYINCAQMEATLLGESSNDALLKNTIQSICTQLQEMDRLVTKFARHFDQFPDGSSIL